MNTSSQNQRQSKMRALQHTTGLSEVYLQLEGFLESDLCEDATDFDLACLVDPTDRLPENGWKDAFITFGVIFTCLLVSSVTLGFGVSKLSRGLQQLSEHICQQSIGPHLNPY